MTAFRIVFFSLFSGFIAQLIKFTADWISNKEPDFSKLFETGGMPSAHSASVMTLSFLVGFEAGFNSVIFAVALFFSLITMYDAAGLRRAAGDHARILNLLMKELLEGGKNVNYKLQELTELLGHTPFEVMMGATLGILFAYCVEYWIL